jgi:hypothetical protein
MRIGLVAVAATLGVLSGAPAFAEETFDACAFFTPEQRPRA